MKEAELVTSCQKKSSKGQEYLYKQYASTMFRLAFRYVKGSLDAEDVVITSFTKVFSSIQTFTYKGEGSLEGWIRRIVINEALMWLRRRHLIDTSDIEDYDFPEQDTSILSTLEAEEIYLLITELPDGYRTVFNLYVIEGYSHQEIAELLDISENTSRSQLFKAKSLLKKMLLKEGYYYGKEA